MNIVRIWFSPQYKFTTGKVYSNNRLPSKQKTSVLHIALRLDFQSSEICFHNIFGFFIETVSCEKYKIQFADVN